MKLRKNTENPIQGLPNQISAYHINTYPKWCSKTAKKIGEF